MKKRFFGMALAVLVTISAINIAVQAESAVNIGNYIQMGTYYGEPILWRCVDIDENGPLMLSDRIICLKPYDASGSDKITALTIGQTQISAHG